MTDPAKLAQIKQLVQTSNILTPQEKSDWLSLTVLMNDKQLAELEEILKLPSPAKPSGLPPITKPSAVTSFKPASGLSHISNVPSQLSHQRSSTVSGPPQKAAPTTHSRLTPMSQLRPEDSPKVPEPVVTKVPVTSNRVRPMGRDADNTSITISSIADLSAISADVLSDPYRKGFYQTLMTLVNQHGYFQVITRLEQSPLYQDYLEYGQQKLAGSTNATLPLSQEEFEFVTDLLLALKVNRS